MSSDPFDEPLGLGDRLDDLLVRVEAWAARSRPLLVAGAVVVAAGLLVAWSLGRPGADQPVDDLIPRAEPADAAASTTDLVGEPAGSPTDTSPDASPDEPAEAAESGAVVHVVGAVRRPGLVTLEPGARIGDAVAAAGGAVAGADVDRLNLAAPVVDGMQIRVPRADEDAEGVDRGEAGPEAGDAPAEREPLVRLPTTGPTGEAGEAGAEPVDLNRASEAELEELPGIGPALAGRIVAWRVEQGRFASVDELEAVPGIGPAKLAALRDLVVV